MKYLIFLGGLRVDAGPKPTYEDKLKVPPWEWASLVLNHVYITLPCKCNAMFGVHRSGLL